MSYHGVQLAGLGVILYGFVAAFVESMLTGAMFTPTWQFTAGIRTVLVLLGTILDPVVEKTLARVEAGAVAIGLAGSGIELERGAHVLERLVEPPEPLQAHAAVQMRAGAAAAGADRCRVALDRARDVVGSGEGSGGTAGIQRRLGKRRRRDEKTDQRELTEPQVLSQSLPRKSVSRPSRS